MLDLKLLETFREVASRGSFSAAADALSFTQPAVSQHIARLEKQLGTKLLVREPRGLSLTEAGTAMLQHSEALLDAARRAEDDVRIRGGVNVPTVRLGAFPTAAAGLVPMAFRELRAAQPSLRLKLRIQEPDEAVDELLARRIDLALVIDTDLDPMSIPLGVDAVPVHDDPMLLVLPAGHPLARQSAVDLAELSDEEWLFPGLSGTCPDSSMILRACDRAGFEPRIHFESDDYQALQGLTASGMGVALIPSLASQSLRPDVVLRPLRGEVPTRRILAVRPSGIEHEGADAAIGALRLAGRRLALGSGTLAAVA